MTLWKSVTAQFVRASQRAALGVRQTLKWVVEARCNQVGNAHLLHPRCCRTEH
jgi:hypothetical protein